MEKCKFLDMVQFDFKKIILKNFSHFKPALAEFSSPRFARVAIGSHQMFRKKAKIPIAISFLHKFVYGNARGIDGNLRLENSALRVFSFEPMMPTFDLKILLSS